MRSGRFFVVLAAAGFACSSFGEGNDTRPDTAVSDGGVDADSATVGADSSSADGPVVADGCPSGSLACHFFDGNLVEAPWQSTGSAKGQFLSIVKEGSLTFGRVSAANPVGMQLHDRLQAFFTPARSSMEIDLDFRIGNMASDQILELASLVGTVNATTYHLVHLTLNGKRAQLTEFAEPGTHYYREQNLDVLADGWHHAKLTVDYSNGVATLLIDSKAAQMRSLAFVPAVVRLESEVMIGLGATPQITGPLEIDMDSVIVRGQL